MNPRRSFWWCSLCALSIFACSSAASRTVTAFNSDWRFYRGDPQGASAVGFPDDSWDPVTLPHTWNTQDAVPGNSAYQGPGWYRKEFLALADWKGHRVFVRFEAASLVAQVFLNGSKVGEHRGGFAAFCLELTSGLRIGGRNQLAVRVDNERGTVSPLGGDFTIFGGLYRPVSLIVTEPVAITPLDYASPGVYLRTAVSNERAEVQITTKVSNGGAWQRQVTAVATILDAQGKAVAEERAGSAVAAGDTKEVQHTIVVQHPHLWDGVADPYLYTARIELFEAGKKTDSVEQPFGLRYFRIDPQRGFILNGKPMQIHGVCRHQDGGSQGWAISEKDQDLDMALMREMGADGVRLVHYQHSPYFYTLCDRTGVLAWAELALVNNLRGTEEFRGNLRQQLIELIRQNYNHPSIVIWSMYNEIGSANRDKPGPIIRELGELAHSEDPTRPTTGAASDDTMANLPDVVNALDLVSLNLYPGWYFGKPDGLGSLIDEFNLKYGSRGVSVSEYGAGASVHQHQQGMAERPADANGRWHPEEWQAIVHEGNYAEIQSRPSVWGSFLWVMFDFASAGRHEGDLDGINDKGLVTRDRAVKKDAYYFYQANWTTKPMVHITSRRDGVRTAAATDVKIYSNCRAVTLKVNGKSYGPVAPTAGRIFIRNSVILTEGDNVVETEGAAGGTTVRDYCTWSYHPKER